MKKLLLFISFLIATSAGYSQAGDICFVHTATTGNITSQATEIDHPALNNNPNAKVLVAHNLNGDGSITRSDNVIGVYYWTNTNKWYIYNEDVSNMIESSSYNVYIEGTEANMITVIAGAGDYKTVIDNPILNNNPNARPIITNYWNPNSVWNDNNYGVYYRTTDNYWYIYNENTAVDIPTGAAFNVLIEPALVSYNNDISFCHQATIANQHASDGTEIDHPLLNNNPDAFFVMTHNWSAIGYSGSDVLADHTYGTFYSTSSQKWVIFTEETGGIPVPENAVFNIAIQLPAPENDNPSGNISVTVGAHGSSCTSPTMMTNVGATDSTGMAGLPAPSCGNYLGGDVFYYFTIPASGQIIISRTNQDWDYLSYSLHESTWANEVACGIITNGTTDSAVITGLTPGVACGLRLWEFNNNNFGTEGFCVREHDPNAGIADAVIDGFNMYPNPVEDMLNIEATNTIESISIYNMLGQEVINTKQSQIDMSSLPTGSYIVKVQAGDQIGSYNLIKQ